jgi:hypothetical protein
MQQELYGRTAPLQDNGDADDIIDHFLLVENCIELPFFPLRTGPPEYPDIAVVKISNPPENEQEEQDDDLDYDERSALPFERMDIPHFPHVELARSVISAASADSPSPSDPTDSSSSEPLPPKELTAADASLLLYASAPVAEKSSSSFGTFDLSAIQCIAHPLPNAVSVCGVSFIKRGGMSLLSATSLPVCCLFASVSPYPLLLFLSLYLSPTPPLLPVHRIP